jgi:hypothetical protein
MGRWWRKLLRSFTYVRAYVREPTVWRKAGALYIRRYQPQLQHLAAMLSRSRDEVVLVTFDAREKAAVLLAHNEPLALINIVKVKDGKGTMRVIVRSNLAGDKAYFQLAFVGMEFDWQPHVVPLLLTKVVPREQ